MLKVNSSVVNLYNRLKNLKDAVGCKIAGGASKLVGVEKHLVDEILQGQAGKKMKVLRVVRNGQVYYSKAYTRMVKRNAAVVLLDDKRVVEIEFFVWMKDSGITLAVYKEIPVDEDNPFYFEDAGHHLLRMKPVGSVINTV